MKERINVVVDCPFIGFDSAIETGRSNLIVHVNRAALKCSVLVLALSAC